MSYVEQPLQDNESYYVLNSVATSSSSWTPGFTGTHGYSGITSNYPYTGVGEGVTVVHGMNNWYYAPAILTEEQLKEQARINDGWDADNNEEIA